MWQATTLSRPLRKGYVQCTACEHWCAVAPGAAGRCGVRRNVDGTLRLAVYARPVAVQVDPIEKKPLHHFLPGSPILSIGTAGCNFRCAWCQNWEMSQWRDFDPDRDALGQELSPEAIVDLCRRRNIRLLAFTYNEPAVFFEYAYDTAKLADAHGIRSVFVSSGYETIAALDTIEPFLDAINVDLKSFRDATYRTYCGARLAPVLRTIEHLITQTTIWTEVTTLVIPGINDSDEELTDVAQFLAALSSDIPWHVTAFVPHFQMTDRPPTPAAALQRAYDIGRAAGLHYVYAGNVTGDGRLRACADTHCPACGVQLIRRHGYHVTTQWTTPGICPDCGIRIAGVWR